MCDEPLPDESGSEISSVWFTNTEEWEAGDFGDVDLDVGGSDVRWLGAGDCGPGGL